MKLAMIGSSRIPSRSANSIQIMKMAQAYTKLGHEVKLYQPGTEDTSTWESLAQHYGLSTPFDIEYLPNVINYELPRSPKDYIHRIGRTGRAESPGEAISFVTENDRHHFKVIQKKMKKVVTMIDSKNINLHGY